MPIFEAGRLPAEVGGFDGGAFAIVDLVQDPDRFTDFGFTEGELVGFEIEDVIAIVTPVRERN